MALRRAGQDNQPMLALLCWMRRMAGAVSQLMPSQPLCLYPLNHYLPNHVNPHIPPQPRLKPLPTVAQPRWLYHANPRFLASTTLAQPRQPSRCLIPHFLNHTGPAA
jgi:hypothetical protein